MVVSLTFSRYNSKQLICPEWPNRQGGCLACWSCKIYSRLSWDCTDLYCARGAQGVLPIRVGGATSQLDLPYLTPLSVAGCGRRQQGVLHWATSVDYCNWLIIDPILCGSRFSTGRFLAIEDFTFFTALSLTLSRYNYKQLKDCSIINLLSL